jgi:hypothetical protein
VNDVYRNMIVTAADAPIARAIAVGISPVAGDNMWMDAYSASGTAPATHYISTGYIGPEWGPMLPLTQCELVYDEENPDGLWVVTATYPGDSAMLWAACQQYQIPVTEQQVLDLYANSDVTEQEPQVALARLGLQPVQEGVGP